MAPLASCAPCQRQPGGQRACLQAVFIHAASNRVGPSSSRWEIALKLPRAGRTHEARGVPKLTPSNADLERSPSSHADPDPPLVVASLALLARSVIGQFREVDGMEFEHSSVALDLRFIPDEVAFEGRQARDKSTSVPSSYQPPSFICKVGNLT